MRSSRHPWRVAFAVSVAVLVAAPVAAAAKGGDNGQNSRRDKLAFADTRSSPQAQRVLRLRAAKLAAQPPAAAAALKDSLGVEGVVQLDPLTSTARFVGRTDGFLTGSSNASADSIAMGYVRSNAAALGLQQSGLAALKLARDYVSIDGTHHLSYVQQINGLTVFGNGLKVNVAKDGRIINIVGSPIATSAGAPSATPALSAAAAIASARSDVKAAVEPVASSTEGDLTRFRNGDTAKLVWFQDVSGLRLAYQTRLDAEGYLSVIDAGSGKVLYRNSTVDYANGLAWDNRPGAAHGGTQRSVDFTPWYDPALGTALFGVDVGLIGNNTFVYSDVNGNNQPALSERILPDGTGNFNYTFTPFDDTTKSPCSAAFPCSWNSSFPAGAFSWQTNRQQNGTQVFFFVNAFHDHLLAAPIGFTEAAGNFQFENTTGQGDGLDGIFAENDDGANTQRFTNGTLTGMPDGNHIDNANMNTPPDGFFPRMQMFLFNFPFAADPFIQSNGGDEAGVIYHEYTHGLSNRLVVDADGLSTLGDIQAGAMGEAWGDWYAEDFLEKQGFVVDTPGVADVLEGEYVSRGDDLIRTAAMDCKVGTSNSDPLCDGDPRGTAGTGGYTYGDFGKIIGRPEVHADGEIWAQTLWDLRGAVGSATAESLVTRAMELSPANPSFLDMRNSILQADMVAGGASHNAIWATFANRGMGFFAGAINGDDAFPVENFALPPVGGKFGKLLGTVLDADTGLPIVGATVAFGGHASGFADDIAAVTNEDGHYDVKKIPVGTYPKITASGPGFDAVTIASLTIGPRASIQNFTLRRNWASIHGGGEIVDFNGPDFAPDCPPEGAIDDSAGTGWGSTTDDDAGNVTGNVRAKFIIVKLPVDVDISEIQVNPSNTCGDPGSSSTRGFRIESSTDGTTFTQVSTGVFYAGDRNRLNTVTIGGPLSGIRFLRFWMLNPQVPTDPNPAAACTGAADCGTDPAVSGVGVHCGPGKDNGFGGCQFMDMVEMKVYGTPA